MTVPQPSPWGEIDRRDEPAVWREHSRLVVSLHGEQDLSTAGVVAETLALARAVADGDVVIDLRDVAFMDSTIVTVLVRGRNRMRAQEPPRMYGDAVLPAHPHHALPRPRDEPGQLVGAWASAR